MSGLEILYYALIAFFVAGYFVALKLARLPVVTFTTANVAMAVLLAMVPGYSISCGEITPPAYYHGFSPTLYLLFCIYVISVPLFSFLGQWMGRGYCMQASVYPNVKERFVLLSAFIAVYSVAYLLWLPVNPLNGLLTGRIGFFEAAMERVNITHQLDLFQANLPVPFRYWRVIMQIWSVFCFLYFFARWNAMKRRTVFSNVFLAAGFVAVMYLLTFTLEKAYAVQFIVACTIAGGFLTRRLGIVKLIITCGVALAASAILVHITMGGAYKDMIDTLQERLSQQVSSVYVQIDYVERYGFLGLRGMNIPFGRAIFGRDYFIDLGRESYGAIFADRAAQDIVGSAGGLSIAELYFNFGWFGVVAFPAFIWMYGFLDQTIFNASVRSPVRTELSVVNTAMYLILMTMYSLTFVSSVFVIFGFPFGLSAQAIIMLIGYVFVVKASSLRIRRL